MTLILRLRHLFLQFLSEDYCLLQLSGANTQPSACAIPLKLGMLDSDSLLLLLCVEDSCSSIGPCVKGG